MQNFMIVLIRIFPCFVRVTVAVVPLAIGMSGSLCAQVMTSDGQTIVIQESPQAGNAAPATSPAPSSGKPSADGEKKEKPEDKKNGEQAGKEQSTGPQVIKRPSKPEEPAHPIESEVTLSDDKLVSFSLRGQPWDQVLQWLADTSELSLDWQELPGDTLNLTTTRSYTLPEARDIVNRHLLARGYSMVLNGELLSVLKLSEVKPSLVPRVNSEQLQKLQEHSLCKMSFDLKWLIADESIDEITPLLSKAGKISKMSRTNRLEIMDTAGSLRDIYNILQEEQSDTGQEQLVKTFPLKYRRASEVIVLLRDLLGVDPPPGGGGGRSGGDMGQVTSVMRQMTQQLQRMAQNSGGSKGASGGREPTKTRLVLNQRENMILAQAMPDQMAIIEKAVSQIDVPVEASNSLLQNLNRMKVYTMETADPQTLVDLLQELGDMSPGTVLKVDKAENSIIAFASLADHLTITSLVERMDQSGREVEVIHLRRLDAEYVAGTIQALMGPVEEEKNSMSSYYRWSPPPPETTEREFQVEPDIESNRLLIYANKVEMNEIMLLLQKLGEIPDPQAADNGMRVFELSSEEDPQELMRRIKELWQRKNRIEFDLPSREAEPEDSENIEADADGDEKITSKKQRLTADEFFANLNGRGRRQRRPRANSIGRLENRPIPVAPRLLTSADEVRPMATSESEAGEGPPVRFGLTSDGRLLVTSEDTDALNDMEDLMSELVKQQPNYQVFYMKYSTPTWVTLNLKDYFESESDSGSGISYDPYWGFLPSTKKSEGKASLGRRRQPRFIPDNFTSTILVRNADRRQIEVIRQLIELYDVPEPADTRSMRITRIFELKNSRAETVAQAVKDVFRDLLSANDKALEKKNGEQQSQSRGYSYFGSSTEDDDDDTPIRFKGLLSVGVDGQSNTIIISSTASLMDTIAELVEALDKAAEESASVRVLQVDRSVDLNLIQERLSKSLGKQQPAAPGQEGKGKGTGQPTPGQPNR